MRARHSAAVRLTRYFELYEQEMYRIAYAILHDAGQAEDAVMAAFEGIVRNGRIPRNPACSKAKMLAYAAVRNAAIDQYRKNARERQRTKPLLEGITPVDPSRSPEQVAVSQAGFDELIESLSSSQRSVLRERFDNEASVKETAKRLGISEAAVRKRQQRAIAEIRTMKGIGNG